MTLRKLIPFLALCQVGYTADLTNVNVGTSANDKTGDALRTAFLKVNANTTELAARITNAAAGLASVSNTAAGTGSALGTWTNLPSRQVAAVQTDGSATPTTTVLRLGPADNAVRIWTGERPVDEPCLDVSYRTNGGNVVTVRLYRWQGRILRAPAGATIQLGTTNGPQTLWLAPMAVSTNLDTPAGVTNWVNCDRAGPPLWAPRNPHVSLPSNSCAFTVLSNRSELPFFVAEFDGAAWTPPRWYILPTNESLTILATYRQVALGNYAGQPLRVVAPVGSTLGGECHTMTMVAAGQGRFQCASAAELQTAMSNAVAGDTITLADGTYPLTINPTNGTFVANQAAGYTGMEGITIRGLSGNRSAVVLTGSATNTGGWWFVNSSLCTLPATFKGLTFNFSNQLVGIIFNTGILRMEDVRVSGPCAQDGILFMDGPCSQNLLRVTLDGNTNSGSDLLSFYGANDGSRVRVIDCQAFGCGTNANSQCITTHNGLPLEIYGGEYNDAPINVVAHGGHEVAYCFFTKFSQPAWRTNQVVGVAAFACTLSTRGNGLLNPVGYNGRGTNAYVLFSRLSVTNQDSFQTLCNYGTTTNDVPVWHNRIEGGAGRSLFPQHGGHTFIGNIVSSGSEGCRVQNWVDGGRPIVAIGNTWLRCTTAVSYGYTNCNLGLTNNAFLLNSTPLYIADLTATNFLKSGYNVFGSGSSVGAYAWPASDSHAADAAVTAATSRPTAAGNADDNGIGLGWCADSDPFGLVWLYHPARAPRGARAVARTSSDAPAHPDAW